MSLKGKRDMSGPVSIMVLVGLFLVLVGVFVWASLTPPKTVTDFARAFGDFAGTVISSFAFVLLLFTVLQQQRGLNLQREDLQLTQQELRETREELQRTADAQQALVEAAKMTAKLNAAVALVDYHGKEMDRIDPNSTRLHELAFEHNRGLVERYRKRIEAYLEVDDVP